MNKGRLEFDSGWTDLAQAFMSIRRAVTAGGKMPTFEASRLMRSARRHCLGNHASPVTRTALAGATGTNTSMMEIFA